VRLSGHGNGPKEVTRRR